MIQQSFLEFDFDEFLLRLTEPEGYAFEAKEASGNIPASLWPTASAFANSEGGVIILGLRETEEGWVPQGVSNAESMQHDLRTRMRNLQVISREVAGQHDIRMALFGDKKLIAIKIHPAPRNQRPVYIRNDPSLAYLRRDDGDFLCTAEERAQMQREASPCPLDLQIIPYLNLGDFDLDAVERYRSMVKLSPERTDVKDFLESIGAYRVDRARGEEGPTFAGILMFGNELAIREIRPNHVIDYRRIPNSLPSRQRWSDRVRWTGHLFGAWEEISPKLARGLPVPFRLEGMRRIDEPAGSEALREAFVNLLVHADYRELSDSVILHRDNGYVFTNPGDSRVPTASIEFNRSERRNPTLAEMFGRAGLADRAGSGFLAMFREWSELGFSAPMITSAAASYAFRLELPLSSLTSAADRAWLDSLGGPWSDAEELALLIARNEGMVTNARLRAAADKEVLETSRVLSRLRDRDLLEKFGTGKDTFYVMGGKAERGSGSRFGAVGEPPSSDDRDRSRAERLGDATASLGDKHPRLGDKRRSLGSQRPRNSGGKRSSSTGKRPSSTGKELSPTGKRPNSAGKGASSTGTASMDADEARIWSVLVEIAAPVSSQKRVAPEVMRLAIERLARVAELSMADFERLLHRDEWTIRNALNDLIEANRVARVLPSPNDPRQRYRTVAHDIGQTEGE